MKTEMPIVGYPDTYTAIQLGSAERSSEKPNNVLKPTPPSCNVLEFTVNAQLFIQHFACFS